MSPPKSPLRAEVRRLIVQEHLTFAAVGECLGISRHAVAGMARKMGIKKTDGQRKPPSPAAFRLAEFDSAVARAVQQCIPG